MADETPASVAESITLFVSGILNKFNSKLDSNAPAVSAAKLNTPITVSIAGDAVASGQTDGSSDLSLNMVLADTGVVAGTHAKVTVDAKGRVTGGGTLQPSDIPPLPSLGIGTMATRNTFISTAEPTAGDGVDGDVWFKYI